MPSQSYIVRNRPGFGRGLSSGIRQQASQLPGLMAQRMQREFQEEGMGLEREKLGLAREGQAMQRKQWQEQKSMQQEATEAAKGTMVMTGGLAGLKYGASEGLFDPGLAKMKGLMSGAEGAPAVQGAVDDRGGWRQGRVVTDRTGAAMQSEQASGWNRGNMYQQGGGGRSAGFADRFAGGDVWGQTKAGAFGGLAGGATGAGMAKAFGARKKWQTALAGGGGGMLATYMAGGDSPFALALGGMMGGGLGAFL